MTDSYGEIVVQGTFQDIKDAVENDPSNGGAPPGGQVTIKEKSDGTPYQPSASQVPVSIAKDHLSIVGTGDVVIDWNDWGDEYVFRAEGSVRDLDYSLDSDVSAGSDIVDYPASQTAVGDINIVHSDTNWSSSQSQSRGEIHVVQDAASGGGVRVEESLLYDYLTSNNARVDIIEPVAGLHVENIAFDGPSPTDGDYDGDGNSEDGLGIFLYRCRDCTLKDVETRNISMIATHVRECYDVDVLGGQYELSKGSGYGYGIVVYNATAHVTIRYARIDECRHGVAHGSVGYGQPRDTNIEGCSFGTSTSHMVDAHPVCESMFVRENHFQLGGKSAVYSGAKHTIVENNEMYDCADIEMRGDPPTPTIFAVRDNQFVRLTDDDPSSQWRGYDRMDIYDNLGDIQDGDIHD